MNAKGFVKTTPRTVRMRRTTTASLFFAILADLLLAGCSGGGNNQLSQPSSPSSALSVTSVSNTSPTPLTVLQLATNGVDPSMPVSVQFSNNSGFSVTEQAIRIASDGTVVVGAPLFIDPHTHLIGPATVSLTLMQSGHTSAPVSLNIQDLPPVSTYGTQPGQISHAFLVFEALLHARRLNELQAAQPLVSSSVNTTATQTTVASLLQASVLARNEIDIVSASQSQIFSWGTLPDGTTLQFDKIQLDVMDRVIAIYLSQQFAFAGSSSSTMSRLGKRKSKQLLAGQSFISSLLGLIASQGSSTTLVEGALSSSDAEDPPLAFMGALQSGLNETGSEQTGGVVGLISGLGHIQATVNSLFHDISAVAACSGLPSCTSTEADAIQNSLNSVQTKLITSFMETYSQIPTILGLEAEASTAEVISQGAKAVLTYVNLASSGQIRAADDSTLQLITPTVLPTISGHWGQVSGTVTITSNLGAAAPQTSLNLCCFGGGQLGIVGLADPGGSYDLFVPIGVAGTNYSSISLSAVDALSNSTLSSQTVDLTGLNINTPVKVPNMSGTCNDTDASNPDGDDPDCD